MMYKDNIRRLYVEPTSGCNLNCQMCFRNSWIDEEQGAMSEETIGEVYRNIRLIRSIETVVFSGMGEPLIHSEISNMVERVSQMGRKTELITNATALKEDMVNRLIDAGLDFLWISVDGSHIESVNDDYGSVIKHIENFNELRNGKCKLGFTFVLINPSVLELNKINEFADKFRADMINLSQVIPCSIIENLNYNSDMPVGKMFRMNTKERFEPRWNYCPFVNEGSCFIKWNGEVIPCMQLLHSSYTYLFNEQRKVLSHSFGNIKKESLSDIWNNERYKKFRMRVKNFEFPDCTLCDGCDDRIENRTDCMFNEMPTCGACLWAQNIARCP